ncbi:MAG: DUF5666 domain-containing protein [Phycisphaerae bacterium]|nr:DUF5666 domain-containing protein [Phycisphaerae bacterium]
MRRLAVVLGAVLVVLLVGGGSFYGGMVFERSRQTNLQAQFFAGRGFSEGGQIPLGGIPPEGFGQFTGPNESGGQGVIGRGANGTIESLEGDTLTLSTAQDQTTVLLTDQTVINRFVAGERGDLQPGAQVTVLGERDDSGRITATTIQILSDAP